MIKHHSSVLVGLSGGVDSCVAAMLLKNAGWDVQGLHFVLTPSLPADKSRRDICERIAQYLHIPLNILDLTEVFARKIIDPFVSAYLKGLTPNPCVMCNELIKFAYLTEYAKEKGFPYVATGHYVSVKRDDSGTFDALCRGKDTAKDQSYFLHRLSRNCLSKVLFPLGDMTKSGVKALAATMDLPWRLRPDSQEICFIPENDYRLLVEEYAGIVTGKTGDIIDETGEVLGQHAGGYRYTIGQRHGLGIASSSAYYVKEIRPETNEVIVGRKRDLYSTRVDAEKVKWLGSIPFQTPVRLKAQIRYRQRAEPGWLKVVSSDRVSFLFDKPQWAVTPGQALVFYKGDCVIGGGWITKGFSL